MPSSYSDIIDKHAKRTGLDPSLMRRIMKIESGGDPGNVTGSYKGLFQLSEGEFKTHGGSGSIYDPEQNTAAAANLLAKKAQNFKEKTGREAKPIDLYMMHQQGEAGYTAHLANPDEPAWRNIRKYYKSDEVAKKAVWGNIPDRDKAKFGSVENVTSRQFVNDVWAGRVEGGEPEYGGVMARGRSVKGSTEAKEARESYTEDEAEGRKATLMGKGWETPAPKTAWVDFDVPNLVPDFGPTKSRALR